jgi:integrase
MPLKRIEQLGPGFHCVGPSLYIAVGKIDPDTHKPGSRSWVFRYVDAGRKRDMGLGSFREISREDAERRIEQLREARRNGVDPIQAKRAKAINQALSVTFEKAARGFFDAKSKGWSASHRRAWLADLERDVFPAIGSIAVNKIGVPEVLAAVEPGWLVKHETTSRNRGRIEKVLDRATALKQRPDEPNPARWRGCLDAILALPSDIKKAQGGKRHHAALDWRNVPAFVRQLHQRDDAAARALEFLILTASRSNEVRDARWSEIDLEARLWVIPAKRMKARQEHLVPLTDPALAILRALPRKGDLVFDIGRDAMIDVVKALGGDVTVHGFRSCFSTFCGEKTSAPRDVVERVLAHSTGSAVEQAYRRGREIEKRRAVLEAWGRFVGEGEKQGLVVIDFKVA